MTEAPHPLKRLPDRVRRWLVVADLVQLALAAYLLFHLVSLPTIEGEVYLCNQTMKWLWPFFFVPGVGVACAALASWRFRKPGYGLLPPVGRLGLSLSVVFLCGALVWQLRGWRTACGRQCAGLLAAYAEGAPESWEATWIDARRAAIEDAQRGSAPLREALLDVQSAHLHNALHGAGEQPAEEVASRPAWMGRLSCVEAFPPAVLARANRSETRTDSQAGPLFALASSCFAHALPWQACEHIFTFASSHDALRPSSVGALARAQARTCTEPQRALDDLWTWEELVLVSDYLADLRASDAAGCVGKPDSEARSNRDAVSASAQQRRTSYLADAAKCWGTLRGSITASTTPAQLRQRCETSLRTRTVDCLARALLDGNGGAFSEQELIKPKFRACEAQGTEEP